MTGAGSSEKYRNGRSYAARGPTVAGSGSLARSGRVCISCDCRAGGACRQLVGFLAHLRYRWALVPRGSRLALIAQKTSFLAAEVVRLSHDAEKENRNAAATGALIKVTSHDLAHRSRRCSRCRMC